MAVRIVVLFIHLIVIVNSNPIKRSVEDNIAEESQVVFAPVVVEVPNGQKVGFEEKNIVDKNDQEIDIVLAVPEEQASVDEQIIESSHLSESNVKTHGNAPAVVEVPYSQKVGFGEKINEAENNQESDIVLVVSEDQASVDESSRLSESNVKTHENAPAVVEVPYGQKVGFEEKIAAAENNQESDIVLVVSEDQDSVDESSHLSESNVKTHENAPAVVEVPYGQKEGFEAKNIAAENDQETDIVLVVPEKQASLDEEITGSSHLSKSAVKTFENAPSTVELTHGQKVGFEEKTAAADQESNIFVVVSEDQGNVDEEIKGSSHLSQNNVKTHENAPVVVEKTHGQEVGFEEKTVAAENDQESNSVLVFPEKQAGFDEEIIESSRSSESNSKTFENAPSTVEVTYTQKVGGEEKTIAAENDKQSDFVVVVPAEPASFDEAKKESSYLSESNVKTLENAPSVVEVTHGQKVGFEEKNAASDQESDIVLVVPEKQASFDEEIIESSRSSESNVKTLEKSPSIAEVTHGQKVGFEEKTVAAENDQESNSVLVVPEKQASFDEEIIESSRSSESKSKTIENAPSTVEVTYTQKVGGEEKTIAAENDKQSDFVVVVPAQQANFDEAKIKSSHLSESNSKTLENAPAVVEVPREQKVALEENSIAAENDQESAIVLVVPEKQASVDKEIIESSRSSESGIKTKQEQASVDEEIIESSHFSEGNVKTLEKAPAIDSQKVGFEEKTAAAKNDQESGIVLVVPEEQASVDGEITEKSHLSQSNVKTLEIAPSTVEVTYSQKVGGEEKTIAAENDKQSDIVVVVPAEQASFDKEKIESSHLSESNVKTLENAPAIVEVTHGQGVGFEEKTVAAENDKQSDIVVVVPAEQASFDKEKIESSHLSESNVKTLENAPAIVEVTHGQGVGFEEKTVAAENDQESGIILVVPQEQVIVDEEKIESSHSSESGVKTKQEQESIDEQIIGSSRLSDSNSKTLEIVPVIVEVPYGQNVGFEEKNVAAKNNQESDIVLAVPDEQASVSEEIIESTHLSESNGKILENDEESTFVGGSEKVVDNLKEKANFNGKNVESVKFGRLVLSDEANISDSELNSEYILYEVSNGTTTASDEVTDEYYENDENSSIESGDELISGESTEYYGDLSNESGNSDNSDEILTQKK